MGQRRSGLNRAGFRRAGTTGLPATVDSWRGTQGLTPTTATTGIVVAGQTIVAQWTLGVTRIYAIDGVNGDDANVGFADPASSSAGAYATACAAAGLAAKKTFAGLAAIFPRYGSGRKVEIVIANGGVNTLKSYGEAMDLLLSGVTGYAAFSPVIRGTGTNTTAGCTAFDGSIADATYQGGITVTGLNVAGYNPTGAATTTSLPCTKVGGAAPAFPAEPAAPLGWRVRFGADSGTNPLLRNVCRQIAQVAGTDTLTPQTAFPAAPVVGDTFYVEQAGFDFAASSIQGCGYGSADAGTSGAQLVGGSCTGNLLVTDSHLNFSFVSSSGFWVPLGIVQTNVAQSYTHPVLGVLTIGGGLACTSMLTNSTTAGLVSVAGLVVRATGSPNVAFINQFVWGAGCYALGGLTAQQLQLAAGAGDSGTPPTLGTTATLAAPRAARITLAASSLQIANCSLTGSGATAALRVQGVGTRVSFARGVCSGATGNTDVGMDLTLARGAIILIDTTAGTPTVTGGLGDVRLAGGTIITWAQALKGVCDLAGNRIMSAVNAAATTAARIPWRKIPFSGSIVGGAGATISYLPDAGPLAANQVVPLRRPVSSVLMRALRVTNLVNTSANQVTVTLYKNGAATTMTIAIPAATAANTKFADTTHPIYFDDADDFDLRMDDAADVGGVVTVSGTLEYC